MPCHWIPLHRTSKGRCPPHCVNPRELVANVSPFLDPPSWSKAQQLHYNHLHWRWQNFARASAEAKPEGVELSASSQHSDGPMGLSAENHQWNHHWHSCPFTSPLLDLHFLAGSVLQRHSNPESSHSKTWSLLINLILGAKPSSILKSSIVGAVLQPHYLIFTQSLSRMEPAEPQTIGFHVDHAVALDHGTSIGRITS
jgi:hypothetical protein